jgi:hypothetical protein
VFEQPARNRLLDLLDDSWRRVGRLDLIVGADLGVRSLSARALEGFLLGRVRGRVLTTVRDADRRIADLPTRPSFDGRFPLNELLCAPDVWPHVVGTLATGADVVLMDFRGWQTSHRAVAFELSIVLERVRLSRIVLLTDRHTDAQALMSALERIWSQLSDASVNAQLPRPSIEVVRCAGLRAADAAAIAHRVFIAAESWSMRREVMA